METAWKKYSGKKLEKVMEFSEDYKKFLDSSKTERESVNTSIKIAKKAGFKNLNDVKKLKAGDKVYYNNRGKSLQLFIIGKKPLTEGINVLGAHIDSPRIDLKQNPIYEDHGLVLLDTHYYGGIKKYQWVAQPLALHGVVCKKDGKVVEVVIGEDPNDPILEISDLLVHLSKDQMEKPASKVIEGEDLNALFGSIPAEGKEGDLVKKNILALLKKKYNIEEADFASAELELVPAGHARDLGLDRSMVMAYGHDDRICAYTSLRAFLDVTAPERTTCCYLTDKEEVGSQGNTGAESRSFENTLAEILDKKGEYSELNLRRLLRNSLMLSSDVSVAYDPNYAYVCELKNSAFFGKGLCFNKYTGARGKSGCNDANPEFYAKIRKVLDDNKVSYQTSEIGKVDQGGGGTIAKYCADLDMEVIDAGICVQNMHACYETASKVDIYEAYLGYRAFIKDIK